MAICRGSFGTVLLIYPSMGVVMYDDIENFDRFHSQFIVDLVIAVLSLEIYRNFPRYPSYGHYW